MVNTKLGKIRSATFGLGGYQGVELGLHLVFSGDEWEVCTHHASWDAQKMKAGKYTQWTEVDRDKWYADVMRKLSKLLADAKVNSVDKLKDIPVECMFDGDNLKDYRVLTEVL